MEQAAQEEREASDGHGHWPAERELWMISKEKHAEVEEEERKWQERHAQQRGPVEGDQVA